MCKSTRKLVALTLATMLLLTSAACGGSGTPEPPGPATWDEAQWDDATWDP